LIGNSTLSGTDVLLNGTTLVGAPFSTPQSTSHTHGTRMLVSHWAEDIAFATNDGRAVARLAIDTGFAIIPCLDAFGGHISPLMVELARNGRR